MSLDACLCSYMYYKRVIQNTSIDAEFSSLGPVVSDVEKWGTITGQCSLKGDLSIGLKSEKSWSHFQLVCFPLVCNSTSEDWDQGRQLHPKFCRSLCQEILPSRKLLLKLISEVGLLDFFCMTSKYMQFPFIDFADIAGKRYILNKWLNNGQQY